MFLRDSEFLKLTFTIIQELEKRFFRLMLSRSILVHGEKSDRFTEKVPNFPLLNGLIRTTMALCVYFI